jgi:osmotically inducible protein OsmC
MKKRNASAKWKGTLKKGSGTIKLESGAFEGPYSFATRFEDAKGTNPEELIAAAHAGCFSMAFSMLLEKAGSPPAEIQTQASVTLDQVEEGFKITHILLQNEAEVPGIDEAEFQKQAEMAKKGCPVSQLLTGARIDLVAVLKT